MASTYVDGIRYDKEEEAYVDEYGYTVDMKQLLPLVPDTNTYKADVDIQPITGTINLNGKTNARDNLYMNDKALYLRSTTDTYNTLKYDGTTDGPVVTGNAGGELATSGTTALSWAGADVTTGGKCLCGGNIYMQDKQLMLRNTADSDQYIKWSSVGDGPFLNGYGGGSLATRGSVKLGWTSSGCNVTGTLGVTGAVTASSTLGVTGIVSSAKTFQSGRVTTLAASGTTAFATAFDSVPSVVCQMEENVNGHIFLVTVTAVGTSDFSWRKEYTLKASGGAWGDALSEPFMWIAMARTQ